VSRISSLAAVGRRVVVVARDEQLTLLAAAFAYYAFVSTVPLVVLALAAASAFGGPSLAAAVRDGVRGFATPEAATLLESALTSGAGRGAATVVGLAVLCWSGLKVFRALDVAFSRIYGNRDRGSLPQQLRDAVLVLGAVAVAVAASTLAVALLPRVLPGVGAVVGPVATLLVLPLAFLPLYYVFPGQPVSLREALPGALLAGLGWTVLAWGFSVYATYAGSYQLYGLLGGVLLVLTWFYAGGLLVLVGAICNAVLATPVRDRQLQQVALRDGGQRQPMGDAEDDATSADDTPPVESVDTREVSPQEVADLRDDLDALAADLESKTRNREELEGDLRQYVRWRQRRGHARGWGPYLVLLYGTVMTLGAFYFLAGGWAILAMIVVWLSTLGLYTLMVLVGLAGTALGVPGRVVDRIRNLR